MEVPSDSQDHRCVGDFWVRRDPTPGGTDSLLSEDLVGGTPRLGPVPDDPCPRRGRWLYPPNKDT